MRTTKACFWFRLCSCPGSWPQLPSSFCGWICRGGEKNIRRAGAQKGLVSRVDTNPLLQKRRPALPAEGSCLFRRRPRPASAAARHWKGAAGLCVGYWRLAESHALFHPGPVAMRLHAFGPAVMLDIAGRPIYKTGGAEQIGWRAAHTRRAGALQQKFHAPGLGFARAAHAVFFAARQIQRYITAARCCGKRRFKQPVGDVRR